MDTETGIVAIIPARSGSKGLPGKNIRPFMGIPLIAHSILLAKSCMEVQRIIVSTDSPQVSEVAKKYGAEVPFVRPTELAQDDTALWPVIRHALSQIEIKGDQYRYVMLLDPTTPCRHPQYVYECYQRLLINPEADGIIGVSKPDFNPLWHSVVEKNGWMENLMPESEQINRRQDAPDIFRINGSIYIWRTEFVREREDGWRKNGKYLMYETPDFASISIDTLDEFNRAELFVREGLFEFPWLQKQVK
ncbi:MAG: cytidylyltransferase domain-containing protein [Elusimicrobiota bacterium]